MPRALLVYGTREGHTAKVARHVAEALRRAGASVDLHEASEVPRDVDVHAYDGVIVAGSVHGGQHKAALRDFAQAHRDVLNRVPNAFLNVCLTAADPHEEAQRETASYVERFSAETGWRPREVVQVAGALAYSQYDFFTRTLMRLLAKKQGLPTDTQQDVDYTDYDALTRFATGFAARLATGARQRATSTP